MSLSRASHWCGNFSSHQVGCTLLYAQRAVTGMVKYGIRPEASGCALCGLVDVGCVCGNRVE
eukprot:6204473-Amphidinium_carterae.1